MSDQVTVPGIYEMDEATYHGDPVPGGSLSSTGARKLLPPSCPAKFAAWRADPPPPTAAMELGTAAHKLALGSGPDIAEIKAENWRTKKASEEADEARAAGKVPLLSRDLERVRAMHDALRAHPLAAAALDPARGGKPEQSLFWYGEASGVWLRARLDWMPDPHSAVRPVIFDYKSTVSAEPSAFAKSVLNFGYHIQAAMYAALYYQLTGVDAPFLFIAQEKEPPYLVSVLQLDAEAMAVGRDRYRRAMEIYACVTHGRVARLRRRDRHHQPARMGTRTRGLPVTTGKSPSGSFTAALAIRPGQDMFDAKQRAALEVLGIKGANNADMAVFMHVCQRTGLDPFSRQIYYISRAAGGSSRPASAATRSSATV